MVICIIGFYSTKIIQSKAFICRYSINAITIKVPCSKIACSYHAICLRKELWPTASLLGLIFNLVNILFFTFFIRIWNMRQWLMPNHKLLGAANSNAMV